MLAGSPVKRWRTEVHRMKASMRLLQKNIEKKRETVRMRIQSAIYSMVVENDRGVEARQLRRSIDMEFNDIIEELKKIK